MIILYYNIIYIIMATKKKKASRPRAPRRVAIKTSLAAADIWANNAALRAQQTRENDILRAELRNQGLEQKLMLQAMKADVERDRLYYKRLADMGDQRAAVALRDIEANSAVKAAEVRPNVTQSVSPEGHDSLDAYDLAFTPFSTPPRGKRGDVREYIRQITRNQADTERRLPTPQKINMPASEAVTAAVIEQLGTPRRPMSAIATPSAVQVDLVRGSPNPFLTSPTPPRSRNASQSQKTTPLHNRSVLPAITENPYAVTQKSTGAPSLQMFGGGRT
jgi:hypothetical protein